MLSLVRPTAHADFAAKAQEHLGALRAVVASGISIEGKHFERRELWRVAKYKEALVGDLRGLTKCAWCELHFDWRRQLDVEHYRPKSEVTCWEGSPPLVSNQPPREVTVSRGYLRLSITYQSGMADDQGWCEV